MCVYAMHIESAHTCTFYITCSISRNPPPPRGRSEHGKLSATPTKGIASREDFSSSHC